MVSSSSELSASCEICVLRRFLDSLVVLEETPWADSAESDSSDP